MCLLIDGAVDKLLGYARVLFGFHLTSEKDGGEGCTTANSADAGMPCVRLSRRWLGSMPWIGFSFPHKYIKRQERTGCAPDWAQTLADRQPRLSCPPREMCAHGVWWTIIFRIGNGTIERWSERQAAASN